MQTTAIVLETLKLFDRMDAVDINMAKRYLETSFKRSLSLDRWITDGDFDVK